MMLRRPSWLVLVRDRQEAAVGLANAAVMIGGGVLLASVVGWWALAVVGAWWWVSLALITWWRVRRSRGQQQRRGV